MIEPTPSLRSDFLDWLRTGAFRGVRLGMTRAECIEKLSMPEDWAEGLGGNQLSDAGLYVWGPLEFRFEAWRETRDHSLDELIGITSTAWQDQIAALFGHGYDSRRKIRKSELMSVIRETEFTTRFERYIGTSPGNGRRILIFIGRDNFQFAFQGRRGHEVVLSIKQDPEIPISFFGLQKLR